MYLYIDIGISIALRAPSSSLFDVGDQVLYIFKPACPRSYIN